jgi:hypothetical protein
VWNIKLDGAFKVFGLQQSQYDTCVYFKIINGNILITAVYVDDLLIFTNNTIMLNNVKKQLHEQFKMKELGEVKHCLGIRISKSVDKITMDQELYIENILDRFGMNDSKPTKTVMNSSETLSKSDCPQTSDELEKMKGIPYQEAIGTLMYLSQCTQPDISFAVNKLSRYNANPGLKHWQAVKHVLRYLRGTSNYKLEFNKNEKAEIICYTDADWAGEADDRKSTSGFVFVLKGGAISWCSKKQPTIALSTCEAEYLALSHAMQEAVWWNGMKSQLGFQESLLIFCDNQSTIVLGKNTGYNPRTKHIDIRHHFIQDILRAGHIKLKYISTNEQVADALTKTLDHTKLSKFRESMGVKIAD